LSALVLGELLAETDLPEGAFSVLPVGNEETSALVCDERLPVVSFTGSGPVGWSLMDAAPRKHFVLELGGNAAAVICPDWTDLDFAANRIATFGNYQAGQSCIAVQRVLVTREMADEFIGKLVEAVRGLRNGDPHDPDVEVGPVVDEAAAERIVEWVEEATSRGAKLLVGGGREGTIVEPTVLLDAPRDSKAWAEEIFGPVLAVSIVDSVDEAFDQVNDSAYGLQAGVFTKDIQVAAQAGAQLDVGGVIIGDVPSFRADQMPYGGVKGSGFGREGVRSAMIDLSEERITVLTNVSL
jgi:acyl-CoA reductase-like NAD-dependent aldehyde dehydrogenase